MRVKMNPEIKDLWLKALRSGKYVQGRGTLQTSYNSFCCLGVLCDIAVKNKVIPDPKAQRFEYAYGAAMEEGVLPEEVRLWAGLSDNNPSILAGDDRPNQYDLSELNDDREYTFSEIADLIEEQL